MSWQMLISLGPWWQDRRWWHTSGGWPEAVGWGVVDDYGMIVITWRRPHDELDAI